ncbi:MAG: hypothetical protein GXZ04_01220 [Clostridiales bacterium]|nr:hypothetical protein [Clostridiales bacterium]
MIRKFLAFTAAMMLLLSLCAQGSAQEDPGALAGTYVLDASPLGMPLTVYLMVDGEGNFSWTNKLVDGSDKGHGVIGAEGDTYLLLYSDSTPESLKMTPFRVEGKTLVFTDRVIYGSSGLVPNSEDPDNILYPTARLIAYEEALGTYAGSHVAEAMGSEILYHYDLVLDYGAAYTFTNRFAMMGEMQEFAQQGTFEIEGDVLRLINPDREGQQGSITKDGILLNVFLSPMSKATAEVSLKMETTGEVAGKYLAHKDMSMMGFEVACVLTLDAFGGYSYEASINPDDEPATEQGTFTLEGGSFVLTSNQEGAVPETGSLTPPLLVIKMPISPEVPMKTELTFYHEDAVGSFAASGSDEAGTATESQLKLGTDGRYTIAVSQNGVVSYEEEGSFVYEAGPMGTTLVLSSDCGLVSTGMVADTINIVHNVDTAMNTLGFKYAK